MSIHAFDVLLFPWGISAFSSIFVTHLANPPTWSLCIEVASILFMPLIALCGRRGFLGLLGGVVLSLLLALFVHPACLNLVFFIVGAAFSRIRALPCRALESALPQLLGRISYSLYLVHGPLFVFACAHLGPEGSTLCVPLVLAAAWLMWRGVERPSVVLSRLHSLNPDILRRMFFSEEKNQKTLISPPVPRWAAMAWILARAPE